MILLLKGKASQALADLIVFSLKWILFSSLWITPSSFLPTLVRFPPTSWYAYCIFLCLHYWEHAAWIRVYYSSSVPKSSLVSISDYSSMCVETGWAGCVLSNKKQFDLYPFCPPEYRQGHIVRKASLYSRSKMTCSLTYYAHRVTVLVFLDW